MTKEELIALSDLNREDNIKYISSEAQGIAILLDSDRYAPTLCKLERAYICGRRKSEERIEQLEKENAELDCQKNRNKFCYSCANATERCFRNEVGCPCGKYKSYKDENAELKKQLGMSNKVYNDNLDYFHHIEEQLTKAKEIIKTFLGFAEAFGYSPSMDKFLSDTKQFLSEVEK